MPNTTNSTDWVLGQGRYAVKRKLGEGGMAFALLALDKTLGADVVLKVPKPNMMADPDFARRFRREIRSMQELTHEHIVKIKDVGEHEGMPFYVMDLLAGGSLQDRFELTADGKQKPMPPESLADWLEPVARALDFIHQRFVHRDIKPANILFDAYGTAFVSDFGIVKAIADGSTDTKQTVMTQAGMVIGTGPYMAPEVSDGKFDGRVDQYALAVTVYQVLSGRVPFDGTSFLEIIKKKLLGKIPPLHELVPTLPRPLTQVIEKGLSLEPNDRYATCAAFAKAVLVTNKAVPAKTAIKGRPRAVCPTCRKPFALPPDPEGKSVICPACKSSFTVAKRSAKHNLVKPSVPPVQRPARGGKTVSIPWEPAVPLATQIEAPTARQEPGERKPAGIVAGKNEAAVLSPTSSLSALLPARASTLLFFIFGVHTPRWLHAIWAFFVILASAVTVFTRGAGGGTELLTNAFQFSIGAMLISLTSVASLDAERPNGNDNALVWARWLAGFRFVFVVIFFPMVLGTEVYLQRDQRGGLGSLYLLFFQMLAYGAFANSVGMILAVWTSKKTSALVWVAVIHVVLNVGAILSMVGVTIVAEMVGRPQWESPGWEGFYFFSPFFGTAGATRDVRGFQTPVGWRLFWLFAYGVAALLLVFAAQFTEDQEKGAS